MRCPPQIKKNESHAIIVGRAADTKLGLALSLSPPHHLAASLRVEHNGVEKLERERKRGRERSGSAPPTELRWWHGWSSI